MSANLRTKNGLEYYISDDVWLDIMDCMDSEAESKIGARIENAEAFPSICGEIAFVIAFCLHCPWLICLSVAVGARFIGILLSHIAPLFNLFVFNVLISMYHGMLQRTFISKIAIVILCIVLKPWYAGAAFLVYSLLAFMLMSESHSMRQDFNDRVVRMVIRDAEKMKNR